MDLGMLCYREVCTCVFTINAYKNQFLYGTCTRIVHVHDPSPYHILAHVLSHVPVFIHCPCPKKTGPPYSDMTPPTPPHPLTLNVPATVQYNYVTPYVSFTTPPITSLTSLHPAPSLNVPAAVPYRPVCTSSRSKSSYISSFSAKSGSCKDQRDINTPAQ